MKYNNAWRCSCCGDITTEEEGCPMCSWTTEDRYYRCTTHSVRVPMYRKVLTPDIPFTESGFYDEDWKEITSWQVRWKIRT